MKQPLSHRLPLLALLTLCSLPLSVLAQQPPAPRPPVMEKLEEGAAPAVTIKPNESGTKTTERREQGKVKEVTVQSGKSTYVVKANEQPGSIQPGEGQSTATRVPQWKVMEFDLGVKKEKHETDGGTPPPAGK